LVVVVCRFHIAGGEKLHTDKHFSGAIVRSVTKLAGINLRKCGSFSYWFDNLGFTTEKNLMLCSSYLPLGVPNWVSSTHHQAIFLAPLPGRKKISARGVSHFQPFTLLLFCFILFFLATFYQKYKKN
jgi:hypothetical protein